MRLPFCLALLGLVFASDASAQLDSTLSSLPVLVGPDGYLFHDGAESWPEQLRATGGRASIQARVSVAVEIDESGRVLSASVDSTRGQLIDEIALATASRLLFQPSTQSGAAVRTRAVVPVYFCWGPCHDVP